MKPNDKYFNWIRNQPNRKKLVGEKIVCAFCGQLLNYKENVNRPFITPDDKLAFCSKHHYKKNIEAEKMKLDDEKALYI